MDGPGPPASADGPGFRPARYAWGVVVTVAVIASQYVVPQALPATRPVYGSLLGDLAIVYGIPVAAFAVLVGAGPLRGWRSQMARAVPRGLGWYGSLSWLAIILGILLIAIYSEVDPGALQLLSRPNPALEQAAGDPYLFVGLSFLVGAFEETIFRGWIYGALRRRGGNWLRPALATSALFAGVHLYYGTTYGAASPLIFPSLFLVGLAFAATYEESGGNLVVPAILHGVNDALAFLTLVNLGLATATKLLLITAGAVIMVVYWLAGRPRPSRP